MVKISASWRWSFVALIVILLPLLPLLDLGQGFTGDWYNHLWQIAYHGEFFSRHGQFPTTYNTQQDLGMSTPVFYGFLFFRVLGAASAFLDENLVLRLAIIALWALEFAALYPLLRSLKVSRPMAYLVCSLVLWAIYPMTNIYHRSAITELVATGLLSCALCWGIRMRLSSDRHERGVFLILCMLSVLFMAGTHPITALFGALYLSVLGGFAYFLWPKSNYRLTPREVIVAGLAGLLILAILSPWIYAALNFKSALMLGMATERVPEIFPFEHYWSRLLPIPVDTRLWGPESASIGNPHHDLQINVPLLILLIYLTPGNQKARGMAVAGLGLALFSLILSLEPSAYEMLPAFFCRIQIGYRMITYVNLSLLAAVLALLATRPDIQIRKPIPLLCLALAFGSVGLKLEHTFSFSNRIVGHGILAGARDPIADATPELFANEDYLTPNFYLEPQDIKRFRQIRIRVARSNSFGLPIESHFQLDEPAPILSNIQAFRWNHLELDGNILPDAAVFRLGRYLGFRVSPGSHRLAYRFIPDPEWAFFSILSPIALFVALAGSLAYGWLKPRAPEA